MEAARLCTELQSCPLFIILGFISMTATNVMAWHSQKTVQALQYRMHYVKDTKSHNVPKLCCRGWSWVCQWKSKCFLGSTANIQHWKNELWTKGALFLFLPDSAVFYLCRKDCWMQRNSRSANMLLGTWDRPLLRSSVTMKGYKWFSQMNIYISLYI